MEKRNDEIVKPIMDDAEKAQKKNKSSRTGPNILQHYNRIK